MNRPAKSTFTLALLPAAIVLISIQPSRVGIAAEAQNVSVELISTFDYPIPGYTFVGTGQINDGGIFVGQVLQGFASLGFKGDASGKFSRPVAEPNDTVGFTVVSGIKNSGAVCGRYDDSFQTHGFFRRGMTFTTYDVPVTGVSATTIESVNSANNFVGEYTVSGGSMAFAYAQIEGTLITIPISGISPEATGINNLDEVVGTYGDNGTSNTFHGFMRASDGTLTFPIDFAGASQTVPRAINDSGYIVGNWSDGQRAHALVIHLPDTFLSYDVPGATGTSFSGINNAGLMVGTYEDQQHINHGFIAQLLTGEEIVRDHGLQP